MRMNLGQFATRTYFKITAVCCFSLIISCSTDIDDYIVVEENTTIRYIGEWNGNLGFMGAVPISMMVASNGNEWGGPFWVSNNYMSCCGNGAHNGLVEYKVFGSSVQDFVWRSEFPGCPGVFSGSGNVLPNGDLEIDITGENCDGEHVATLWLGKVID